MTSDGAVARIEACREETDTAPALATALAQGAGVACFLLLGAGRIGPLEVVGGAAGTVLVLAYLLTRPLRRAVRALTDSPTSPGEP
jgi:hypothetical protein